MHITKQSTQSTQFHTQGNRDPVSTTLEFTLHLSVDTVAEFDTINLRKLRDLINMALEGAEAVEELEGAEVVEEPEAPALVKELEAPALVKELNAITNRWRGGLGVFDHMEDL